VSVLILDWNSWRDQIAGILLVGTYDAGCLSWLWLFRRFIIFNMRDFGKVTSTPYHGCHLIFRCVWPLCGLVSDRFWNVGKMMNWRILAASWFYALYLETRGGKSSAWVIRLVPFTYPTFRFVPLPRVRVDMGVGRCAHFGFTRECAGLIDLDLNLDCCCFQPCNPSDVVSWPSGYRRHLELVLLEWAVSYLHPTRKDSGTCYPSDDFPTWGNWYVKMVVQVHQHAFHACRAW